MNSTPDWTLPDLHRDEALRQHEFPVARQKVFLAHAGVCAVPRLVAETISRYALRSAEGDQETLGPAFQLPRTRELAARLLGTHSSEVAFVGPTSLALSYVASGIAWEPGDEVLCYAHDYPSNVYPWLALEARGVQVHRLKVKTLGQITPEDVEAHLTPRTRLVALASCHFLSGYRLDVSAIGQLLRERGILFSLDAIQTVGAFPTLARDVDFLSADSHKWMLGPSGAGLLYVRKEIQEQFQPPVYGWHNILSPNFLAADHLEYQPDARRYEVGSSYLLGLSGFHSSLEMLLHLGVENIEAQLLKNRGFLVRELLDRGWDVLHHDQSDARLGGMVSFRRDGWDHPALHASLEKQGIQSNVRHDPEGREWIRFSPHFYNTESELGRALEALPPL